MRLDEFIQNTGRMIAFFPSLACCLGRTDCLLVCQLIYWRDNDDEWVEKTMAQIEKATTLTRKEQRAARARLVALGILEEVQEEEQSVIKYRVDGTVLHRVWEAWQKEGGPLTGPPVGGSPNRTPGGPLRGHTRADADAHNARAQAGARPKQQINKPQVTASRVTRGFGSVASPTFSEMLAKELENALRAKRKLMRQPNRAAWAKEFRELRSATGIEKETLQEVVTWYCGNLDGDKVPQAYSAKSFRDKYPAIEAAMRRGGKAASAGVLRTAAQLLASGDAEMISVYRYAKETMTWTNGSDAQLPAVVEISIHNYRKVRKKLDVWLRQQRRDDPQAADPMHAFGLRANNLILPTTCTALRNHLKSVSGQLAGWREWSGDLLAHAWSMDNKVFQRHAQHIANDYDRTTGRKYWERLMELLK